MSRALLAVLVTAAVGGVVHAQPLRPIPAPPAAPPPTHNLWVAVESNPGDFTWQYKGSFSSEQLARDAVATHCPGCPETTTPTKPSKRTYIVLGINKCPDNSGDLGKQCPSKIPVTVPGIPGNKSLDNSGEVGVYCAITIPVTLPCGGGTTYAPGCQPCPPFCQPCPPAPCERPRLFPLFRRCR